MFREHHGELWAETATVDPPMTVAITTTEAGAADSGLTHQQRPSVWEMLTDSSDDLAGDSGVSALIHQLNESPRFRRGQVAASTAVIAEALSKVSWDSTGDEELSIPVGTVTVLADLLLRHQP